MQENEDTFDSANARVRLDWFAGNYPSPTFRQILAWWPPGF